MEDFRMEHRDGHFRNWDGDSCSEIIGTVKVNI